MLNTFQELAVIFGGLRILYLDFDAQQTEWSFVGIWMELIIVTCTDSVPFLNVSSPTYNGNCTPSSFYKQTTDSRNGPFFKQFRSNRARLELGRNFGKIRPLLSQFFPRFDQILAYVFLRSRN